MSRKISTQNGIVASMPGDKFGYMGWPTCALLPDGSVCVGASALRRRHICPWGKTVLWTGSQELVFSGPQVINDSPLDDRDVGLCPLPDGGLLATFFTLDSRIFTEMLEKSFSEEGWPEVRQTLSRIDDATALVHAGAWVQRSDDGGRTWQAKVRCPVTSPHGPIALRDGSICYLGKLFPVGMERPLHVPVACAKSFDVGKTWQLLGEVPLPEGKIYNQFHEPHIIECQNGDLRGYIRYHGGEGEPNVGVWETISHDGGKTWAVPTPMDIIGTPPHIFRHSSGAWVLSYGYREQPYGQRARVSLDEGKTWGEELILRDDGPDADLGYPSSVELNDGSVLTVYYQREFAGARTSLLYTKWRIDA